MTRPPRSLAAAALAAVLATAVALCACESKTTVQHRERSPQRDKECADPASPHAYFYPAQGRNYWPDDPRKDGCTLLVPDHVFCCPAR